MLTYNRNDIYLFLVYILLLFPVLAENILETLLGPVVSRIFIILSMIIIFFIIFFIRKKINISIFTAMLFFLVVYKLIIFFALKDPNVIVENRNNLITPYGALGYFVLFLFLDSHLSSPNSLRLILKAMMYVMTISVLLNIFITGDFQIADNLSTFREAISTGYTNSRSWLFGHRNLIFIHHLMWISISFIYYSISNKNYQKIFYIQMLITFFVGFVSWNSTMLMVSAIIFVIYVFENSIFRRINILIYLTSYFVLEFGIVFFRIQEFFSYIIVNLLNRNLTLTGRTFIWNGYIDEFLNSSMMSKFIGNLGVTEQLVNTHNMFLGLMLYSGLIGLFLYFSIVYLSAIQLYRFKNMKISKILSIIYFGFLVNSLTMEFYLQPLIVLYFGYSVSKFLSIRDALKINNLD